MKRIPTLTTYLEMRKPCMPQVKPPVHSVQVKRLESPTVEHYRFLYHSVGKDYNWVDRILMPDDELSRILEDDAIEIYVLKVGNETAGFAELDLREPGEVELGYFGLFPDFIGMGLGKYFLVWTLNQAWSHAPTRVWLHTCDLDHPAALNNYRRAGLTVYDRKTIQQVVPDRAEELR